MDKRIIINADDFGLSDTINEAVKQAHTNGVLTSTTIMTNMPAAKDAVKIAKKLPALGVGVHLNLSIGTPLSNNSSANCLLNKNGELGLPPARLAILSTLSHKFRTAIRTELASQIQWVIDNGLAPTHLDSHKHIHSFPPIFPIVCELAWKFNIPAIRFTYEPKQLSHSPWPLPSEGGRKRAGKIRTMAKINRLQNADFLKTDALLGIVHIGKINVTFFRAVTLYNPVATAEIMTHPAVSDSSEPDKGTMLHQQTTELEALCSERTKEYFKNAKIKLVHFGQL
ncbi:MAG: ChbG/HpnK family deacetylase [Planctomycetota bacterium]|nr:MAG: ChbG/HpnK family deacetylase [Planctomycetota bacterium]